MRPTPRPLDPTPHERTLETALPPGQVDAELWIDTGGDQMRAIQVGLGVTVRTGTREITQQFASCDEAGHGADMAVPPAVDAAACDSRTYELLVLPDAVVVRSDGQDVTRIPLR